MFKPNHLSLNNGRGDIFGGLTAAIVALPLALAFGVASGVGPVAGLYGAICVGLFAALFGGTPSQISGPTGPMTIVSATIFTQFATQPSVAFTVVMLAGVLQILFGYLRLGRFINLMPYPVISGFMTGVGCILIIMQLEPLLGYPSQSSVINALSVFPAELARPNLHALLIGVLALVIVFFLPKRWTRIVPSPLLALVCCTLVGLMFNDLPVLGEIPSGLPAWHVPTIDFPLLNQMLVSAAVLAALGSIDSLLTSLVADNMTRTFHDSNKELVGQGIGNLVAGFAGGLPGAGATIRTLSNIQAGGRTALSGMVHAFILLAVVLGLAPLLKSVPHAALAGLLVKVGIDVIDWRFIRRLYRAPRMDMALMLLVLLLTVFVDVVTAVGVGIVLASLALVKQMADVQAELLHRMHEPEHERLFDAETSELYRQHRQDLMFLHLSGLISFAAANELTRRFATVGEYKVLIIDMVDVPSIDGSAALAMEDLIQGALEKNRPVILVGMTFRVARMLERLGALDEVRETERFKTRKEAVQAAVAHLQQPDQSVV
ncbi:MAG TPA: SulP family inorganic anion transporter [Xanthomonadales bacterium]|nr:SulP family inorganic anion transporter [Xanthomonadales bacterium]